MTVEQVAARYLAVPSGDKGLDAAAADSAGAGARQSSTKGKRIGLYGGSFNPPHEGHLLVAETALKKLRLDSVWWLVSPGNPLKDKSGLAPLARRLAAVAALLDKSADKAQMRLSAFEQTLERQGNLRGSAAMLQRLVHDNPQTHFVWIMGADNLAGFHLWQNWQAIMRTLPIAVIDRPRFSAADKAPAAQSFADARLSEAQAADLALHKPPAWLFVHGKRSNLSSTMLREQQRQLAAPKAGQNGRET